MENLQNLERKKQYLSMFDQVLTEAAKYADSYHLVVYVKELKAQFIQYEKTISKETIWLSIPKLIGIDTKLRLVLLFLQLLEHDEFETSEIVQMVEKDFKLYHRELLTTESYCPLNTSFLFLIE